MTAQDIYKLLLKNNIKESTGYADFTFLGVTVRVTAKSAFGYVFQDWLEKWMEVKEVKFKKKNNSQDWPDMYLDPSKDNLKGLVEIKTFDFNKSPNFDIANFDAYTRSLKTNAHRLDADYLIFGYKLNDEGSFSIADIWIKKVWEISSPSGKQPIKSQVKQGVIVNIRPTKWYSKYTKYKAFDSRRQYVKAINNTLLQYSTRKDQSRNWLKEVVADYKKHTNRDL